MFWHLAPRMSSINGLLACTVSTSFPVLWAHHVGRLEDLLGRVPLYPCYLDGNTPSTIPYKYAGRQKQALNSGVQTAKALHHAGAAMYMRSTTGCGTLADPSLELEDFLCPKLKGSAEGAGPRHPGALGDQEGPHYGCRWDMISICLVYALHIPVRYSCWVKMHFEGWYDVPRPCSHMYMQVLTHDCRFITIFAL